MDDVQKTFVQGDALVRSDAAEHSRLARTKCQSLLTTNFDGDDSQPPLKHVLTGSGAADSVWSDGCDEANYAFLKKQWNKSGMKYNPTSLTLAVEELDRCLQAARKVDETFDITDNAKEFEKLNNFVTRGRITLYEGLIFYHCSAQKGTPARLASALRKEQKERDAAVVNGVCPALQSVVTKALEQKKFA